MTSPIRKLVHRDAERHGAVPVAASDDAAMDGSPLQFFLDQGAAGPDSTVAAAALPHEAESPRSEDSSDPSSATSTIAVDVVAQEEGRLDSDAVEIPAHAFATPEARPELLDILAALAPVFKASMVFPGEHATVEQVATVVGRLSREAVQLADAVARDADVHEIDLAWMRRRAGAFAADMVASQWLTSAIRRGGGAPSAMSPAVALDKLAAGIESSRRVVRESEAFRAGAPGAAAAVFGLGPVLLDLQRYADLIEARFAPEEVHVDIDAAAKAITQAINDEVDVALAKLSQHVPQSALADLAAELSAQAGGMAKVAWEIIAGAVLGPLDQLETNAQRRQLLADPQLQAGVPVDAMLQRLRVMMRRLVGASEYAAAQMLGGRL